MPFDPLQNRGAAPLARRTAKVLETGGTAAQDEDPGDLVCVGVQVFIGHAHGVQRTRLVKVNLVKDGVCLEVRPRDAIGE